MTPGSSLRRSIADVIEEELQIAIAEHAGDDYACLEDHDCADPGGHLFHAYPVATHKR